MISSNMSLVAFRKEFEGRLNDKDYIEIIKRSRKGKSGKGSLTDWIVCCIFGEFETPYSNKIYATTDSAKTSPYQRTLYFFTEELKYIGNMPESAKDFMKGVSASNTFLDAEKKLKDELEAKGQWGKWEVDFKVFINILTYKLNKHEEEIIRLFKDEEKQVVLTGAPGTGKTYLAKEIAKRRIILKLAESDGSFYGHEDYHDLTKEEQEKVNSYIEFVQFHPSYDYTDFVEGLRPTGIQGGQLGFGLKNGIFKNFCKKALNDSENDYFFIIDEINRAELSKVFGELMYSLEKDYRGEEGAVGTQYSTLQKQDEDTIFDAELPGKFYIPKNVFIIGTMNDIDRSVEVFDFALRRRFAWYELKANDVMKDVLKSMLEGKLTATEINDITERAKKLNDYISKEGKKFGLNDNYHIGPSYFGKIKNMEREQWQILWERHIGPIIKEYVRNRKDADEFIKKCKDIVLAETEDTAPAEQPVSTGGGSDEQRTN